MKQPRFRASTAIICLMAAVGFWACTRAPVEEAADLLIHNGRIYSLGWGEPGRDGTPSADAPRTDDGWRPDAEALAIRGGIIVFVGSNADAEKFRGEATQVLDADEAVIVPGLIDSHTHVTGLGELESQINLVDVATEEDAVALVVQASQDVPPGEWILGRGWDEGAWANNYPTVELLDDAFPDNPVVLDSLHGFAVWGNSKALEAAGITRETEAVSGGEILRDADGNPSGILLNRAGNMLTDAIPEPSPEQFKGYVVAGLQRMARDGYVAVHEAGVGRKLMTALEELEAAGELPIRVYAMLSARDPELCREWIEKGPTEDNSRMLVVRSVKAYYDGALGSRGARLLEDYSDRPGHTGVSGGEYGFDEELVAQLMQAGFQVGVHAIGDAGNRETLDFLHGVIEIDPEVKKQRHRIEHAQVVHPDDFKRFAEMDIVASMEPPHCAEDKTWAEQRLGPERIKGAYAWRSLRQNGVRLAFNSDLMGSDHDIFYGLHSAMTRRDKNLQPPEGWYPEERMTPEEALRGYTIWGAYAGHMEDQTGILAPGRWGDVTLMSIDPLNVGETEPGKLFDGKIVATVVGGTIVHQAN